MKRTKKLISVILTLSMLLCCFAVGCGQKDSPKDAVNSFCTALLKYDLVTAVTYTTEESSVEELDIESKMSDESSKAIFAWIKEVAKDNSFKIESENKVDDSHYTVKVVFSLKDLSNAQTDITTQYKQDVINYVSEKGTFDASSDEGKAKLVEILKTSLSTLLKTTKYDSVDYSCEWTCVKTDKGWKITEIPAADYTRIMAMNCF